MSARPGTVEIAGTLAGPESAWSVTESGLAAALESSGMPAGSLRLLRDGGWLTVEPSQPRWSAADFHGAPGEALGAAVRSLARGGRPPEEWGSTLRLTHYGETEKTETLVGLAEDGIHAVGRAQPWQPVPEEPWWAGLRRSWWIILLLAVACGGWAWLQRDALRELLFGPTAAGGAAAQEVSLGALN